jgi:glycosyltransferase involved in cell wall biosynthesis
MAPADRSAVRRAVGTAAVHATPIDTASSGSLEFLVRIGLVVAGGVDRSGRERVLPELLDFIERLARQHDVHVFALQYYAQPCDYPLLGATVHDLGRVDRPRGARVWRMRGRLRRAVERIGAFDLLHAYWGMPAGVVALDVARALGIRAVVTLTTGELVGIADIEYGLQRHRRDRRAIDRILRYAGQVTVPTHYMQRLAGAKASRVVVMPMGLNRDRFAASTLPDGPPWRLLRVATINRVKDYPLLLHAFAHLVQTEPDARLDIVGEDLLGGAMRTLAERLSVGERVTFHGYQPIDRLPAFYAQAHVHVVSSHHEASSVTAIEAALAGVATVGTAVGHLADWATLDPPAACVSGREPAALADAITGLLRDPSRRRRLAAAARSWALEHDADWSAAAFERLYERVAAAPR